MKHSYTNSSINPIACVLLICLALISTSPQIHATTTSNYIEMGLALANIPVDMAAHYYTLEHGKQAAAPLHCATAVINLLNKLFFFYNNTDVQTTPNSWRRDRIVHGIFAIRDITQIIQSIKESSTSKDDPFLPTDLSVFNDEQFAQFLEKFNTNPAQNNQSNEEQQAAQTKEISKTSLAWQVGVLPLLKGLTSFLVAWTQDESHSFSGEHARFVATASHSLARLLDEYTALDADSPYRKVILGLMVVNIVWLIAETKGYYDHLPRRWNRGPIAYDQACSICGDTIADFEKDESHNDFRELQCGHVYCKNCLKQYLNVKFTDKETDFTKLSCPKPGCNHLITSLEEINNIVDSDTSVLTNYNEAAFKQWCISAQANLRHCPTPDCKEAFLFDNGHQGNVQCPDCHQSYCGNCLTNHPNGTPCPVNALIAGGEENARWIKKNARRCKCGNVIERNGGCNHMICTQCNHHFCYVCGRDWAGHTSFFNCNFRRPATENLD